MNRAISFILAVIVFTHSPALAAGFSISGLFAKKAAQENKNSQTMELPKALAALELPKGGGDITIVGESALLPDAGPLGTAIDVEDGTSDQISIYVVRKGDTLSSIAKMFGVSVNTVVWANDLKSLTLTEGATLVILPVSGIRYTIKQGDTLKGIVAKYKGDLDEVLRYNGISLETKLTVGDTIIIPDAEGETIAPKPTKNSIPGFKAYNNKAHDTNGPNYDYYYIRPFVGGYLSQGLHGYNGVDLAGPLGTTVVASAPGTVLIAKNSGWNGGYGNYIVLQHPNGTQTVYGHLRSAVVEEGSTVSQGQTIGYLGSTGRSTGPHVHFEVRGAHNPFAPR